MRGLITNDPTSLARFETSNPSVRSFLHHIKFAHCVQSMNAIRYNRVEFLGQTCLPRGSSAGPALACVLLECFRLSRNATGVLFGV